MVGVAWTACGVRGLNSLAPTLSLGDPAIDGEPGRLMTEPTARDMAGVILGEERGAIVEGLEKRLVALLPKAAAKGDVAEPDGLELHGLFADPLEAPLPRAVPVIPLLLPPPLAAATVRCHRLGDALGLGVPITPTFGL